MKTLASLAAPALLLLGSCSTSATLGDSWRDPNVRDFAPAKTVVVVMSGETNYRRVAEEAIVHKLGSGRSGTSYAFLDVAALADPKQASELARSRGFDSALVVRVLGGEEKKARVPGSYTPTYVSFSGQSYSTAYLWPASDIEGEAHLKQTFLMESDLFALGDDKLVWSGVVEISNPDSSRELAHLNAEAVLDELRAQKLLR